MSEKVKYSYVLTLKDEMVVLHESVLNLIADYTNRNLSLVSGYVAMQWLKKDMESDNSSLKRDYGGLEELLSDLRILAKATDKDFIQNTDFFTDILDIVAVFVLFACVKESKDEESLGDLLLTLSTPVTGELSRFGNSLNLSLKHYAGLKFYELLKGEL